MDHGRKFKKHIFRHRIHFRPILDIGTVTEFFGKVLATESVVDPALVYLAVEVIWLVRILEVYVGSGCDDTSVGGCGRNGARVHQGYKRYLALTRLRSLAVGEIARGVADGKSVVRRNIAGSEARTAEGGLYYDTGLEKFLSYAVTRGGHVDGHRLRIGRY